MAKLALRLSRWRPLRALCQCLPSGWDKRLKVKCLKWALSPTGGAASLTTPQVLTTALRNKLPGPRLQGINLVGYVRSESGLGESVRLSAAAAAAAELPFSLNDFSLAAPSRQADTTWVHRLAADNSHGVNLFHINAAELLTAQAVLGPAFFAGRYNIGYWAWELPELPDAWLSSFPLLQEVWVPSRFIQEAVSRKSPLPVIRMPHAIHLTPNPAATRAQLGLPESPFLFLTMYDSFSVQARKNPTAAIAAFHKAFPDPRGVALVVKINNPQSQPKEIRELKAGLRDRPGVIVLDRILSRQETYDLEHLCDCFVSLHRAEGFGLGLAECMFLGKPTIGTDWSGNQDFMTADNSCPVRCRLVPLEKDYGPYPKGQVWAEPDLEHAAWYMRRVVEDPTWARGLASRGRETILTHFSPQAIGRLYANRLRLLGRWHDQDKGQER